MIEGKLIINAGLWSAFVGVFTVLSQELWIATWVFVCGFWLSLLGIRCAVFTLGSGKSISSGFLLALFHTFIFFCLLLTISVIAVDTEWDTSYPWVVHPSIWLFFLPLLLDVLLLRKLWTANTYQALTLGILANMLMFGMSMVTIT